VAELLALQAVGERLEVAHGRLEAGEVRLEEAVDLLLELRGNLGLGPRPQQLVTGAATAS
jgi:hypothetical protein